MKYILKKEQFYNGQNIGCYFKTKHYSLPKLSPLIINDGFDDYNQAHQYMLECLGYERQVDNKNFKIEYDIMEVEQNGF